VLFDGVGVMWEISQAHSRHIPGSDILKNVHDREAIIVVVPIGIRLEILRLYLKKKRLRSPLAGNIMGFRGEGTIAPSGPAFPRRG
jgi:hypothetical protein